ncbi:MAG: DUF928 domain-containing protein [Deltaproteobacteria bacterium]|nr:DUF928 domain-containing protein [Deltaproteobacteria bacterium]
MSKAHDSREGLAALLADVLSDGAPDPTLLVRYADDPSALSPEERQMVESHLAESPKVRDQLKVLKRFDFSEARESSDRKSGSWLSDALDRVRRLFETRPVLAWAPAIAVAALVLLLIYPSAFSIFRLDRSSEPTSEPVPEQIADDPSAPSTVHQDRSSEPASEPVPEQIADERILEQTPATPTAHVPSSIVLVAAMPEYRAPHGATPRLRSGVRGFYFDAPYRPIMALAPEHVGQTASEAPSLYWYLSEIPETPGFEFWIGSADSGSAPGQPSGASAGEDSGTWIRKDLPSQARPGLQRILLSDYGVELEAGVEYSWTILSGLDADPTGWITRVELPAAVAKRLTQTSVGEAPAIYAEAGLWYDALSSLLELVSDHPNNGSLKAARLELLRQGGLEAVDEALAEHER